MRYPNEKKEMNKAYKFRLYPTNEQKEYFMKCFGCCRFIYNIMLEDKINYYEAEKKMLLNTPAMYKNRYEWLKEVDSLALANVQMALEKAYKNFFRNQGVGYPKFKSKHHSRASYTTNNQKGTVWIQDNQLKVPKLKSTIKVKQHRVISTNETIKSATISKTKTGKFYVSILVTYEKSIRALKCMEQLLDHISEKPHGLEPIHIIGLDFSMKELYVANNGEKASYPRYYRQSLKKLKREQRKLSFCEKRSRNREKQRLRVAKIHEKITNQRKDFQHKQSRQITNIYDVVVVESLDLKAISKTFGQGVGDNGYRTFVDFLNYKLKEEGKQLVKIDKWYPSSKTCSQCGVIKPSLGLSTRTYDCACGYTEDRDINAGINIRREGIRMLLSAAS